MLTLYVIATALIFNVTLSTSLTGFNVGFYNTFQGENILDSVNDISGNNPPSQQTAQLTEIKNEANELNLDVLCLSDLYLTKQLEQYKSALNELFPHSFSQLDVKPDSDFTTPRTACTAADFLKFAGGNLPNNGGNCTQKALMKCDAVLREPETNVLDFTLCMAQECPLNYEQILYTECPACMKIFTEANNWDPNVPGQAIGLAIWGCGMPQPRVMNFTDGTLILSKYEIKQSLSLPIPSFIWYEQRVNVVQLDVDGNDVYVGCLSMNPTTYKDNVGSYVAVTEEQRTAGIKNHIELNEMQIEEIMTGIDNVMGNSDYAQGGGNEATVILMGDLGIGKTWHEENFGLFATEGLESYGTGECTFCVNEQQDGEYYNPLAAVENSLFDSTISKDLDHILLSDENGVFDVKGYSRFMTAKTYESNGEMLPYSPRWGVIMELETASSSDGTQQDESGKKKK